MSPADYPLYIQSLIQFYCPMRSATKRTCSEENQARHLIKSQVMDNQIECPICLQEYDLLRIIPMMICFNQHSTCNKCVANIFKKRKCPVCCQKLIPRNEVKKNRLVCFMMEEMIRNNGQILLCSNTYTYKGEMKNGKRHGIGEQITKAGTFIKGQFVNGEPSGKCEVVTKNEARFEGEAKNGRLEGIFTTKYGSIVQGSFDLETLSGPNCKKKYTNGDQYLGMVNNLKANGFGKLKFMNGNTFEGSFIRDYISSDGEATITGTFQGQIRNGVLEIKQIEQQIQGNPQQSNEVGSDHFQSESSSESQSSFRRSN